MLELAERPDGGFAGRSLAFPWPSIYGGQLVAQSIIAAGRRSGGLPTSAQFSFLRAGSVDLPLEFDVLDDLHEPSSHRSGGTTPWDRRIVRIVVQQAGKLIMRAEISVSGESDVVRWSEDEWQSAREVPKGIDVLATRHVWDDVLSVRVVDTNRAGVAEGWIRVRGADAVEPLIGLAQLAFTSDVFATDPVMTSQPELERGEAWDLDRWISTSLDHRLWFHRVGDPSAWYRTHLRCDGVAGGRGLAVGGITDMAGRLVLSVAQEHLVRRRQPVAIGGRR